MRGEITGQLGDLANAVSETEGPAETAVCSDQSTGLIRFPSKIEGRVRRSLAKRVETTWLSVGYLLTSTTSRESSAGAH